MPIYEYRCRECDRHVEIIQKVGDRPLRKCAACGGRLEKLISRTAFLLKGGGWYAEGYTRGGEKTKSEPAAASGGEDKGKKKTAGSEGGGSGSNSGKNSASGRSD